MNSTNPSPLDDSEIIRLGIDFQKQKWENSIKLLSGYFAIAALILTFIFGKDTQNQATLLHLQSIGITTVQDAIYGLLTCMSALIMIYAKYSIDSIRVWREYFETKNKIFYDRSLGNFLHALTVPPLLIGFVCIFQLGKIEQASFSAAILAGISLWIWISWYLYHRKRRAEYFRINHPKIFLFLRILIIFMFLSFLILFTNWFTKSWDNNNLNMHNKNLKQSKLSTTQQ